MAIDRFQANVRMTPVMVEQIDRRRIELSGNMGRIPTRSEVVRIAVEEYLAKHYPIAASTKGKRDAK